MSLRLIRFVGRGVSAAGGSVGGAGALPSLAGAAKAAGLPTFASPRTGGRSGALALLALIGAVLLATALTRRRRSIQSAAPAERQTRLLAASGKPRARLITTSSRMARGAMLRRAQASSKATRSVSAGRARNTQEELQRPRHQRSAPEVLDARRALAASTIPSRSRFFSGIVISRSSTSSATPCAPSSPTEHCIPRRSDNAYWLGDSRGKWEGDTLVVDVVDFNDETWSNT